jgi:hypothetical protein
VQLAQTCVAVVAGLCAKGKETRSLALCLGPYGRCQQYLSIYLSTLFRFACVWSGVSGAMST